jgi:DNA-binding response OmpR family regulator/anti-sigma regulatory factor (Ser/Thr protein kinase)
MREAFSASAAAEQPSESVAGPGDAAFALREAEEGRERAEAALEAKSRLLATMSHEIRTPLNGMMGCADLLMATGLSPEQRAYVDAIRTSGKSLATLIDEILDFSKVEAGKITLAELPFDLTLLVEGTIEILAPRAHAKGLDIASFISVDVPQRVVGDAARLRQVLLNLLGNAVKFAAHGGVGLRVTRSDENICFAVADTGPGVVAESAGLVFDEFAQAAPREAGGTGLGLPISRQLAARMGGRLELERSSPRGATFILTLPLPAAVDAIAPSAPVERRILVVSPAVFGAPYLVEKLCDLGFDATRAPTLKSGLGAITQSAASNARADTLIIDCALGRAATLELASAARSAGIAQILVLFAAAERRAYPAEAMAVFDGWLVKPLRLRSLLARFDAQVQIAKPPKSPAAMDLAGRNILIAEDNDINAMILEKYLGKTGANVKRVSDGATALRAVQTVDSPFDAMILDLRMPGLDGLALAREVRRREMDEGHARCRLIAVSADAFADAKTQAHDAGIDVFLTKPLDFAALDAALAGLPTPSR